MKARMENDLISTISGTEKKKAVMLLIDVWVQWAFMGVRGEKYKKYFLHSGGMRTLEDVEYFLRRHNILDKSGFPVSMCASLREDLIKHSEDKK